MATNPYEHLSEEARELCIQRMIKTLTKKPRTKQARLYVRSLTGKPETPDELRARARTVAVRIIEACAAQNKEVPLRLRVRKDRRSPMARVAKPEEHRPWNCRGANRQRWEFSSGRPRPVRDMETVHRDKLALHVAQRGLCALCGGSLHSEPRRSEMDHVIPRALNGSDEMGNFVLCHAECNRLKGNDIPTGCEMIWLLAVNAKLGLLPVVF